jgi:hypothetical protein
MIRMQNRLRGTARAPWLVRSSLIAVLAQGLCFAAASAQGGCRTPDTNEEKVRNRVADIFISSDFAEARAGLGIHTLSSGVTKTIITDAASCNAIYAGILTNIDSLWTLPAGADKSAALATQSIHYFRVGDYYAAMIVSNGGGVFALGGWADVMIFNRTTLQFIGVVRA